MSINIDQRLIKVDERWWTHKVYSVFKFTVTNSPIDKNTNVRIASATELYYGWSIRLYFGDCPVKSMLIITYFEFQVPCLRSS